MGTGGSRLGSGRPGYKVKGEQLQRLDIRVLRKRGLLWVGGTNTWSWSRGDENAGSIRFTVNESSVRLIYSVGGVDASQTIWTTTTPCAYGGSRRWYVCPVCSGRCEVLYQRSGRFACRSCQRVSYTSQSGSEHDRMIQRYHRLNALVDEGKPKWQRWATFNRLEDRLDRADEQANYALMRFVQPLQATVNTVRNRGSRGR